MNLRLDTLKEQPQLGHSKCVIFEPKARNAKTISKGTIGAK